MFAQLADNYMYLISIRLLKYAVVDPVERIDKAKERGVQIQYVLTTHSHYTMWLMKKSKSYVHQFFISTEGLETVLRHVQRKSVMVKFYWLGKLKLLSYLHRVIHQDTYHTILRNKAILKPQ